MYSKGLYCFASIFKVVAVVLIMFTFSSVEVNAQSTVYLIAKKFANAESEVTVNGKDKFELRGPLGKVNIVPPTSMTDSVIVYNYKDCIKKCTFNKPGKVMLHWRYDYTNPVKRNIQHYETELQLNLTEGSVHYIEMKLTISNDIELVELPEKKGRKIISSDKYIHLPEYIK